MGFVFHALFIIFCFWFITLNLANFNEKKKILNLNSDNIMMGWKIL